MELTEQLYEALKDLLDDVRRERAGFGRGYEVSKTVEELAANAIRSYEEGELSDYDES